MLTDLTTAQRQLADCMSELSEEAYSAAWMDGIGVRVVGSVDWKSRTAPRASAHPSAAVSSARTEHVRTFYLGFCSVLLIAALFNALSVARIWVAPSCADCLLSAGVPFPFIAHGGFVTETFVIWRGVLDNVAATAIVALLFGLAAERMLKR